MKPTKDQLAPNVPPLIRDYIDACIAEAVEKAKLSRKLQMNGLGASIADINAKLEKLGLLEREVRSHLGIYKEE